MQGNCAGVRFLHSCMWVPGRRLEVSFIKLVHMSAGTLTGVNFQAFVHVTSGTLFRSEFSEITECEWRDTAKE